MGKRGNRYPQIILWPLRTCRAHMCAYIHLKKISDKYLIKVKEGMEGNNERLRGTLTSEGRACEGFSLCLAVIWHSIWKKHP